MKKFLTTLILVLATFVFLGQTFQVNLSGNVFDENTGEPIEQIPIWVMTDSITDFFYYNTLTTDGSGGFEDSFAVPAGVEGTLFVSLADCEGMVITSELLFSENNSDFQLLFSICGTPFGDDCEAMFYSYPGDNDMLTLQFMDGSFGFPTAWDWDFGDGSISSEQNPLHTFPEIGEYLVSLTISDDSSGCMSSIEMPVIVGDSIWFPDSCMAWFFAYPDSSDYMTFNFMDMSLVENGNPPANWYWDFGDGSTSEEQNPTHTFSAEGIYAVCLTISDDNENCTSTYCEDVQVVDWDSYCQAEFYYYPAFDDDSLGNNEGLGIQFVDYSYGNPTSWSWDFGDGSTSDNQSPVHVYEEEGIFNVCLTIANLEDSCESTICQEVFVINDTIFDCYGWFEYEMEELSVEFSGYLNNSQEGNYTWDFGDGTTGEGQMISHTYAEDGIYAVTMMVEDTSVNCYTSYTEILWVGEDFSFDISGYVYLEDSVMADIATVHLMTFDTLAENLISVAETQIDENGFYQFEEVSDSNCIYFVQADLSDASAYYGEYIPTYHISAMVWEEAWPVFPFPMGFGYDIFMIPVQSMNSGPGIIDGDVTYDGERTMLEDVNIMLLDVEGNPYTFQKTGASGTFDFSALPFGTYVVYTEIVGVHTIPVTVELTENNQDVHLNIVVKNGEAVLGIGERQSAFIDVVGGIYPNPVSENASINLTVKQATTVRIEIMNNYGQVLSKMKNSVPTGTHKIDLNTESLPKGIYFISVKGNDGVALVKKLVKL